jgi:hypothetical protein
MTKALGTMARALGLNAQVGGRYIHIGTAPTAQVGGRYAHWGA